MIPDYILTGLRRYAEERTPVGGFLTAVLENDLMEAVCRADENSLPAIRDIVLYVYNDMPSGCHGSPEKVAAWLKGRET